MSSSQVNELSNYWSLPTSRESSSAVSVRVVLGLVDFVLDGFVHAAW